MICTEIHSTLIPDQVCNRKVSFSGDLLLSIAAVVCAILGFIGILPIPPMWCGVLIGAGSVGVLKSFSLCRLDCAKDQEKGKIR